jgi:predicted membrane channel-forming protein YqfA (hemolysin III family)
MGKIRMKMSKFKIAVLVLLVVTIIYGGALYQSVQAYNQWKQDQYVKHGVLLLPSFFDSQFGRSYAYCNILLSFLWVISLAGLVAKNSNRKNMALLLGVITIIGVLCVLPEGLATETL